MNILKRHPIPWKITMRSISSEFDGTFAILDKNNLVVIDGGTYSHDGDMEVNLNQQQAYDLVLIVNQTTLLLP